MSLLFAFTEAKNNWWEEIMLAGTGGSSGATPGIQKRYKTPDIIETHRPANRHGFEMLSFFSKVFSEFPLVPAQTDCRANSKKSRGIFLTKRLGTEVYPWDRNLKKRHILLQWWAKWRLSTFDHYPGGEGHGVQEQICDILWPQLAMNRFLSLLATHSHTLDTYNWVVGWGWGGWGAQILDRSRAFDLLARVDAHLCMILGTKPLGFPSE